jgi:hypothetical protein
MKETLLDSKGDWYISDFAEATSSTYSLEATCNPDKEI